MSSKIKDAFAAVEARISSLLDSRGREIPDPTPVAITLSQPNQRDYIRDIIRRELSALAYDQDHETFEEADDFNVDDDIDPSSPYEEYFDPATGESNFTRVVTDPAPTPAPVQPALEAAPVAASGEAPPAPAGGPAQ